MPSANVNGVQLHYEMEGQGAPMVLIHGSWTDHAAWGRVVPGLARSFRVVRHDRRGHSRSERPSGPGSVHDDVADVAALLEFLECTPAHVVGSSYGGCIALRLAAVRPDLAFSVVAHEPPFFGLLNDSKQGREINERMKATADPILRLIEGGRNAEAAQRFVEDIAFGPGAWASLPPALQQTMTNNAPTFLDENRDVGDLSIAGLDALRLEDVKALVLLSEGDQSPPYFSQIEDRLASRLANVVRYQYQGAGHAPQVTHPQEYVECVQDFAHRAVQSAKAAEQVGPADRPPGGG